MISAVWNARRRTGGRRIAARVLFAAGVAFAAATAHADPQHGIAMHGEPALPPDFDHLAYANPDAPKGGRMTYAGIGTFDSLNPLIVNGTAPRGLWDAAWGNNIWEALLVRNRDEAFSLYGLLAELVDVPDDRSSIEFTLRPEAKFSDGQPVTVDDVMFSIELLGTKGRPNYRAWYDKIAKMEKTGERSVRFTFKSEGDREIPLLIGLMPILPKHATDAENFDKSSLAIPMGSGPYTVADVSPGRYVTLKRNPDYWGKDLPIKRGFDNFDEIKHRVLSRHEQLFRSLQEGPFRLAGGVGPDALGLRLRFSGGEGRPRHPRHFRDRRAEGHERFRLQHAAPAACRSEGARGAHLLPRFRVAEQQSLFQPLSADRKLLPGLGAFRARASGERCGEGASRPLPRRCPRRSDGWHLRAAEERRLRPGSRHARQGRRASEGSRLRGAGRQDGERGDRRAARASSSWRRPATRSVWRLPISAGSRSPASRSTCGSSIPRSSTSARRPSTST